MRVPGGFSHEVPGTHFFYPKMPFLDEKHRIISQIYQKKEIWLII